MAIDRNSASLDEMNERREKIFFFAGINAAASTQEKGEWKGDGRERWEN